MNITYTGKQEFLHPTQKANLEAKFDKISKLLDVDGKGEKQAHVRFVEAKNQHKAEITLNYLDHGLVGEHSDPDQFTALHAALEKLEKQILKVRDKRRDIKKGSREGWDKSASADTAIAGESRDAGGSLAENGRPKVFRVGPDSKPMTLEEAILVIDPEDTYVVYRDAATDGISVLVRRGDGNFDLVEC